MKKANYSIRLSPLLRGWWMVALFVIALLAVCPASVKADSFSLTGSINTARLDHTATLLPNGQVLVAGGWGSSHSQNAFSSAELYNPASGTWTSTGSMTNARVAATATLLPNGQVLVAGG